MAANEIELFCVIMGDYKLFSIDTESSKTVGRLRKMICEENKNTLSNIDPKDLNLYHVEISDIGDMEKAVKEKIRTCDPLDVTRTLAEVFEAGVPKDTIIIVQTPQSARPSPIIPFTPDPAGSDEMRHHIAEFEIWLRSTIETIFAEDTQLPVWQPSFGLDTTQSHIAGLKIPVISASPQSPSLLLHNLGQPSHDTQLAARVNKVFRPIPMPPETVFVCNTSGSGKTRLLLEGLCRNWGYYFTARTQPEGVGSSDLEVVLRDLEERLKIITDENGATALITNRAVAARRSLLILYARSFVFRVFLECADRMPGRITENHKKLWVLIQVAPKTFFAKDVFLALARLAGKASKEHLEAAIEFEHLSIERLLGHKPPSLFVVLDEAQVPANMFLDRFLSRAATQPRPILREIILTWTNVLPNLIVSGTGVLMREMGAVIDSVLAKEGGVSPTTITEIGGFDEVGQQAYLKQYLPPGFLDTPEGRQAVARAGYWLRGRHRFTATYLSRLIQTSFESPHRVLEDFVYGMTGFRPSDWDGVAPPTVKLEKPRGFGFSSLLEKAKEEPELLTTCAAFVFEYTFTGKIRGLGGPYGDKLVEFGVSRFKTLSGGGDRVAETDEPLAILALLTFFKQQGRTLEIHVTEALHVASASARGLAFEPFGAYLLARAFSAPTRLDTVFEFIGEHSLEDELGELVTLERIGDTLQTTPLDLDSDIRSSHVLGCSPSTNADTLEWLKNPGGSAFCFPANTVGPDLIFVLRLTPSDKFLRVCVQFKHTAELGPTETQKAIHTTSPLNFLSHRKGSELTISNPPLQLEMVEAIKNLGAGTNKAGICGVLRVVISYPSPLAEGPLENAMKGSNGHPLATVALKGLEPPDSKLGQAVAGLANQAQGTLNGKRKSSDEPVGRSSKRHKPGP